MAQFKVKFCLWENFLNAEQIQTRFEYFKVNFKIIKFYARLIVTKARTSNKNKGDEILGFSKYDENKDK